MAIAYINHKAGMHFSGIVKPNNQNVGVVLGRNLSIHISGWENVSVDMESRRSLDPSNLFLNRTIFKSLEAKWGPFDVDLFCGSS